MSFRVAVVGSGPAGFYAADALLKSDEGYGVSVPGLPGCWSQGATEEEALENIQDAIRAYLATRDELLEGAVVREVDIAS